MDDQSLREFMSKLTVPEHDPGARARALHRAQIALANRPVPTARSRHLWLWGASAACAAVVIALLLREPGPERSVRAEATLLSEMESLFPGQIEAVIQRGDDVSLELATEPSQPSAQPLCVWLMRGKKSVRVLSYSGRRISVTLDGTTTWFDALLTEDETVILAGEDFLWSKQHSTTLGGYRIEAHALNSSS